MDLTGGILSVGSLLWDAQRAVWRKARLAGAGANRRFFILS